MDSPSPRVLRPRPRRPNNVGPLRRFDIATDTDQSEPSTPNEQSQSSPSIDRLTPLTSATTPASSESLSPQQRYQYNQQQHQHHPHSLQEDTTTNSSSPPFEASRTRSILNLTTSTLQGIYGNACDESSAAPTPGTQTPITLSSLRSSLRLASLDDDPAYPPLTSTTTTTTTTTSQKSQQQQQQQPPQPTDPSLSLSLDRFTFFPRHRRGFKNLALPLLLRATILFAVGYSYGALITHLHNNSPRYSFKDATGAGDNLPVTHDDASAAKRAGTAAANMTMRSAGSWIPLWWALSAPWPLLPSLVVEDGQWWFRLAWGVAGVVLGGLLPYFDFRLELWGLERVRRLAERKRKGFVGGNNDGGGGGNSDAFAIAAAAVARRMNGGVDARRASSLERRRSSVSSGPRRLSMIDETSPFIDEPGSLGDWNPMIRGIGVFVGIAFAIRNLPWESTQQVSATLALVNPFLWYLVDGTAPGFALSFLVGVGGSLLLLLVNPDIVPPPDTFNLSSSRGGIALGGTALRYETVAVATWIASVLFCSCVCFGNIGRRLMLR